MRREVMKKYIHCIIDKNKDISKFSKDCLTSFSNYLPDYEIKYWSFDDIDKIDDEIALKISKINNL